MPFSRHFVRRAHSNASNLIYYDISCKEPGVSWAPNPLKVRYVLNYKKIPYESVFLSMPDIAANHKRIGIPAHDLSKGANFWEYTCGAIQHGDVKMQEGAAIIDYRQLEQTWPDRPSVYPFPDSKALSDKVAAYIRDNCMPHFYKLNIPHTPDMLDDKARFFIETRTKRFGVPPVDFCAPEELQGHRKGLVDSFKTIAAWLQEGKGPYLQGETPSYGDFIIAAHMTWALRTNPDAFELVKTLKPLARLFGASTKYLD